MRRQTLVASVEELHKSIAIMLGNKPKTHASSYPSRSEDHSDSDRGPGKRISILKFQAHLHQRCDLHPVLR